MVYKTAVIVISIPHLPMSRVGTQFQCTVFLSLLILTPFYCVEESAFDIESDGVDSSDGVDPELLVEMVPLPQPIQSISQKQSLINEQLKNTLTLEYSRPTYPESKHIWQTDIRTTYLGKKYSKPTFTESSDLEPKYLRQTKSMNLKPKYPILFKLLKKHLLRTKNALSTKSSNLKELIVELEARLQDTSPHFSMESKVENKLKSPMYSNQNDKEEKPVKKATTTINVQKFIKVLLEKLNRPSTEKYLKIKEPLGFASPSLIANAKRHLRLSSERVKDDHKTKFNNLTKNPMLQKIIQNETFMYLNQTYGEGERKFEKEFKRNDVLSKEKINYLSTEKYSNTVMALKFIKQELTTTANTTLPSLARKVDHLAIFKQNMTKDVINEYTSPTNPNNNSWKDESKIEQSTKSSYNILWQESTLMASSTPKQMRGSREFIAQDQIPTLDKDLPWWSEEVDQLEVKNSSIKLSADAKGKKMVKNEQTFNSNVKEKSEINFKRHLAKSPNKEITKEELDNMLLKDATTTKFPKTTESLKSVTQTLVTAVEEVNELKTKNSTTNASTEVNTKRENKIEQTSPTKKELNKKHSKEPLSYNISNENLVKNSSTVKPKIDSFENVTQKTTQIHAKRGVPLMLNLNNLEESDADDNTLVQPPKTSKSRNNSSWKEFLKDLEKEQQFFYEEPFHSTEYSNTEAKNVTDMKVNKQDKNKKIYKILPGNTPTGILGTIIKVTRNLVPNYILSLLNFDVSQNG